MSNRVEELERKVSELQAAVNGLTEELVETKERVRQLEDDDAVDETVQDDGVATVVESGPTDADADADTAEADGGDDAETSPAPSPDDEEAKSDDADEETESESLDDSDIIVA